MDKIFSYTNSSSGAVYFWDMTEIAECFVQDAVERLDALEIGDTFQNDGGGIWERIE